MIERTIDINGEITEELTTKVVGELREIYDYDKYLVNNFLDYSREIIGSVTLSIDSVGGCVSGFSRIKTEVDKLKELGITIKTYVTNQACSCAFLIFLLGDERDGSEFCMLMNHISTTFEYGKVTSNQRLNDFYMEMEDRYNEFIVSRTKIEKDWLIQNQEVDQWFNYDDCIELGIFTKADPQILTIDECIDYFENLGIKVVDDVELLKPEETKPQMTQEEFDTYIESLKDAIEIIDDIEYDEVEDE